MRSQMRVDRVAHSVGLIVFRDVEMRNLPKRMNAGIGATCNNCVYVLLKECKERFFNFTLNSSVLLLLSPTEKLRTVITKRYSGTKKPTLGCESGLIHDGLENLDHSHRSVVALAWTDLCNTCVTAVALCHAWTNFSK